MSAIVTLKKGEGRTIKAGGMWIFDNEIDTVTGDFADGDMVVVKDFDGYPMGRGVINRHSKIKIRLMARRAEQGSMMYFYLSGCGMHGSTARRQWM